MTDLRLNPQPDWPDRSAWWHGFSPQPLHDYDYPVRSLQRWNDAEDKDLMRQLQDGVQLVEIARRHQRHVHEIDDRRIGLLCVMEKRLLDGR